MTNFTFTAVDDDGAVTSVMFDSETWVDTFPKYLNLLRGAGFSVSACTTMHSPGLSQAVFEDRDFLYFEDEESKKHSHYYCDKDRNK